MTLGTRLFTLVNGVLVGKDSDGNRYYTERRAVEGRRTRRWVIYNGAAEASKVPAEWHGWLHCRTDDPPPADGRSRQSWQRDHEPNHTGTAGAYRPPGHVLSGGIRDKATGDYQPWTPS
ncbi:MAG: NADH:ubiquinone oxidoreductase subunit NDUFA12 [Alphaproteobacteria bacterium]